jgi:Ca2+-binding RTX toxin-like protein
VDVKQIVATNDAFAALRQDGSVITWGNSGGDSSAVASSLNGSVDVKQIYSTAYAFAALRVDGSIINWGKAWDSNTARYVPIDNSAVAAQLNANVVSAATIASDDVFSSSNHAPTGIVSMTGIASQGQTLTASHNLVDADGLGVIHYTWSDGTAILSTASSYTLKTSDVGHRLSVIATYTDKGGIEESKTSSYTGVIGSKVIGTNNADTLTGTEGNDSLSGGLGNDSLTASNGDDTLDGGSGSDTLTGGTGNDLYIIDSAGDKINEAYVSGIDTIKSAISINSLATNVENISLTGSAINAIGNNLANTLIANSANNHLLGYDSNDVIWGMAGNDTLNGGGGNDSLTGGAGRDIFQFSDKLSINVDAITDFIVSDDTIQLDNAIFSKLTATGALNSQYFKIALFADDTNDFIIYNKLTGDLFYDADANGGLLAIPIATLGTNLALTAADFVVI